VLQTRITIDLPSAETALPAGPGAWIRRLFGARVDLRSGYDALTVSAWSLLHGLRDAFAAAGVTDAVRLEVDGAVVYADPADVRDDLDLLVHVAERSGVLERAFEELRLVLNGRRGDLALGFDVVVHRTVLHGERELAIDVTARPDSSAHLRAFEEFVADLAVILGRVLDGAAVSVGPATVDTEGE
jgi:hypothetical protein